MATTNQAQQPDEAAPRPRRRLGRVILLAAICIGAFVYFLPNLASRVVKQPEAMALVSQRLPANVEVGGAELAWQQPVKLNDVKVTSNKGKPVAQIDTVASGRSLWEMITRPEKPLQLDFDGLRYSITVPVPGESQKEHNLYTIVRELQTFKVPKPNRPMSVNLKNSGVDFRNGQGEIIETWEGISATYEFVTAPIPKQTFNVTIPYPDRPDAPALTLVGSWDMTDLDIETFIFDLNIAQLSAKAGDAWLRHYLGNDHGLTHITGKFVGTFEREPEEGWKLKSTNRFPGLAAGSPETELKIDAIYDRLYSFLQINQLQANAPAVSVNITGKVDKISGPQIADLQGHVQSPGVSLIDLLPPEIRQRVHGEDLAFSDIRLRGPLSKQPPQPETPLEFSATARWKLLSGYGLQSDNGEVRVTLNQGALQAHPVRFPINGGTLRRLPSLDLTTSPPTVRFEQGTVLENVNLTESVCRDWLKYVSPTLANATATTGTFSLATEKGGFQLQHLQQGDLPGTLTIHRAEVRPGPLAAEMLQSVGQLQLIFQRAGQRDLTERSLVTVSDEPVRFRLYEGRVHHEQFRCRMGNVPISTTGSVGLDDTLNLLLTMGMPPEWTANAGPVLQALAGEQVQVAIGGTLNQPQVDGTNLAEFGKRAGLKAGAGLLEKILEGRPRRNR